MVEILSIIDSYHDFNDNSKINAENKIIINDLLENHSFIIYLFKKSKTFLPEYINIINELFGVNDNFENIIMHEKTIKNK